MSSSCPKTNACQAGSRLSGTSKASSSVKFAGCTFFFGSFRPVRTIVAKGQFLLVFTCPPAMVRIFLFSSLFRQLWRSRTKALKPATYTLSPRSPNATFSLFVQDLVESMHHLSAKLCTRHDRTSQTYVTTAFLPWSKSFQKARYSMIRTCQLFGRYVSDLVRRCPLQSIARQGANMPEIKYHGLMNHPQPLIKDYHHAIIGGSPPMPGWPMRFWMKYHRDSRG